MGSKSECAGPVISKVPIPESPPRKRRKVTQLDMQNTLIKRAATLQMFLGKDQPNGGPINVTCRIIRTEDGGNVICSGNGGIYVNETISHTHMKCLVDGHDVINLINKLLKTDPGFAKKWQIRFSKPEDKDAIWKQVVDILEERERQRRIEEEKEQKEYENRQCTGLMNLLMYQ